MRNACKMNFKLVITDPLPVDGFGKNIYTNPEIWCKDQFHPSGSLHFLQILCSHKQTSGSSSRYKVDPELQICKKGLNFTVYLSAF